MPSRQDGGPVLKLFYLSDFPDLSGERFSFISNGNKIMGYRYFYNEGPYKGAVIFHHGMGAGHNAYMSFLYTLAKHGYLVYAYDNSCCGDSEGKGWWNFASSLIDQENFYKWFETDPYQKGLKRYAIGHSWGGFTVQNSVKYPVDKIVSISGFPNIVDMLITVEPKLKPFRRLLKGTQKHYYGEIGNINNIDLLQNTSIPTLLMHGENDLVSNYQKNFVEVKEKLKDNPNIKYVSFPDKAHQPYMTTKGQNYYLYLNESGIALGKVKPIPEIDYDLLVKMDDLFFKELYKFLDD